MELGLSGRTALVVGGSAGIGLATARQLAEAGARVTIAARDPEQLDAAAHLIAETTGGQVDHFELDVTAESAEAELRNRYGTAPLDVLVVTVGGSIRGELAALGDDDWRSNYELNVLGPVHVVRALAPNLAAGRSPSVVILGAAGAKMPYKNQVVSNVHKAGVLALVKTLSHELVDDGIRVNAICPGRTRTRLWLDRADAMAADEGTTPEAIIERFSEEIPLGRFAEPDEIASAVVFVASDRASYLTGQSISVDGGIGRGLI